MNLTKSFESNYYRIESDRQRANGYRLVDCLNRTIIGLKDKQISSNAKVFTCLNRTIIGLKEDRVF